MWRCERIFRRQAKTEKYRFKERRIRFDCLVIGGRCETISAFPSLYFLRLRPPGNMYVIGTFHGHSSLMLQFNVICLSAQFWINFGIIAPGCIASSQMKTSFVLLWSHWPCFSLGLYSSCIYTSVFILVEVCMVVCVLPFLFTLQYRYVFSPIYIFVLLHKCLQKSCPYIVCIFVHSYLHERKTGSGRVVITPLCLPHPSLRLLPSSGTWGNNTVPVRSSQCFAITTFSNHLKPSECMKTVGWHFEGDFIDSY